MLLVLHMKHCFFSGSYTGSSGLATETAAPINSHNKWSVNGPVALANTEQN